MTKIQKAWLGFFVAMFVVPEVLWSPVGNALYEMTQTGNSGGTHPFRVTSLENTDNINILSSVLFIQFLGVLLTLIYLIVLRKQIQSKGLYWFFIILFLLLTIVTFFVFGLSVSLRNIGF